MQTTQKLDLKNKQSLVDLLMQVQVGKISCRRAATLIQEGLPKPQLTETQRTLICELRREGRKIKDLARLFKIHPATVWRIVNTFPATAVMSWDKGVESGDCTALATIKKRGGKIIENPRRKATSD